MTPRSAPDLVRVEEILQKACGLTLSSGLRKTLHTSFSRAAEALGMDEDRFGRRLLEGDAESVSCLVEHSVVGETYFFRHPEQFAAVRERLVRDFGHERSLRIWSAGCATGEEPYSLSMELLELGRGRSPDEVLGTDVSERALRTAREGEYGRWSLRRLDPQLRARYFEPVGEDRYRVAPTARRRVEFRRHNLVNDPPPIAGCHVVFCRNVLIYFSPETTSRVLHSLAQALAPGGLLVLGPVEVPQAATLALEWVESKGATILRKPDGKSAPAPRAAAHVPPPPAARKRTPARAHRTKSWPPARAATVPVPEEVTPARTRFEQAREAAREGRLDEAERLAKDAASAELSAESFLLLSMAAESRGDLKDAVEQARRALYLDPAMAVGHALLVALFQRLGRPDEAERSRRNALRTLEGLDDGAVLRGVEAITAGALRRALEQPVRR